MFVEENSASIYLQGMRDRSMRSGTKFAREIQLNDWSTAGNLSNRSSGVQIPRDIWTRFGRYLYSTRCSWIIKVSIWKFISYSQRGQHPRGKPTKIPRFSSTGTASAILKSLNDHVIASFPSSPNHHYTPLVCNLQKFPSHPLPGLLNASSRVRNFEYVAEVSTLESIKEKLLKLGVIKDQWCRDAIHQKQS